MGSKMMVAFANISVKAHTKKKRSRGKDMSMTSLCGTLEEINGLIEQADRRHQTITFTAEISGKVTIYLHTCVDKGDRFKV